MGKITYKVLRTDAIDRAHGINTGDTVTIVREHQVDGETLLWVKNEKGEQATLYKRQLDRITREYGVLFNPRAWWFGAHYSRHNKRLCINLVPTVTFWITKKGGKRP